MSSFVRGRWWFISSIWSQGSDIKSVSPSSEQSLIVSPNYALKYSCSRTHQFVRGQEVLRDIAVLRYFAFKLSNFSCFLCLNCAQTLPKCLPKYSNNKRFKPYLIRPHFLLLLLTYSQSFSVAFGLLVKTVGKVFSLTRPLDAMLPISILVFSLLHCL